MLYVFIINDAGGLTNGEVVNWLKPLVCEL